MKNVSQHYFSEVECNQLSDTPHHLRERLFYTLWTCKEAVIKAIGQGLTYPFKEFNVHVDFNEPPKINFNNNTSNKPWSLNTFIPYTNYIAAFATQQTIKKVCYWIWE